MLWGFDGGIEAALAVGIPYVLTFYFILAVLEDTGYLNSMAFLTDTVMHRMGLHGRAVIPMVAGAGCNVPAIIGTRVLPSKRERFIASTLIALVPCSARIAVIMGGVSLFAGWGYGLGVFGVTLLLIGGIGFGLNRIMPGRSSGLVMEMFPLRVPSIKTTLKKTWFRFRDFIFVALPIVTVGSLVLGLLYETGWVWKLSAPLKPIIVGWLGLPLVTGLTLFFAVLRKELALQFLVTFAIAEYGPQAENLLFFMDKTQLFVYGLVTAIYIPCVATIAVLWRELGWKKTAGIITLTAGAATLLGGIAYRILSLF
jgi:ferrous iron transport protein B